MATRRDLIGPPAPEIDARDAELLRMVDAGFSLDEIVVELGSSLAEVYARLVRLRRAIEVVASHASDR